MRERTVGPIWKNLSNCIAVVLSDRIPAKSAEKARRKSTSDRPWSDLLEDDHRGACTNTCVQLYSCLQAFAGTQQQKTGFGTSMNDIGLSEA